MNSKQFKQSLLNDIYEPYRNIKGCPLKTNACSRLVFGSGNPDADIIFIGEAPGKSEDEQGLPFVGRSGQLLNKTLAAFNVDRSNVFITNIVKCRPPENRKPTPPEVVFFKPLLLAEIKIIRPRIICTLGLSALESLTNQTFSMTKVRGKPIQIDDMLLIPTFHPAYILRNPPALKDFTEDLSKIIDLSKKDSKQKN